MLGVEILNSLDFLRVFFSTFRYYGCSGRYGLLLQFFNVCMGIVSLKDQLWQNQPELYRLKYANPLPRAPSASNGIIPWPVG
jgi:hypothetical protein